MRNKTPHQYVSANYQRIVFLDNGVRKSLGYAELQEKINFSLRARLPQHWPIPKEQKGYYCGLLALSIALAYANLLSIPVTKVKETDDESQTLLSIAQTNHLSVVGEILSVKLFSKLMLLLGCDKLGEAIQEKSETYIQKICDYVDRHHTVIMSCDIDEGGFPAQNNGDRAHWILVFGYVHLKGESGLHFLTVQYGRYFLCSAEALEKSNRQDQNVIFSKSKAQGVFISRQGVADYAFYPHEEIAAAAKTYLPHKIEIKHIPEKTLSGFYCSMFAVPTSILGDSGARRERSYLDCPAN